MHPSSEVYHEDASDPVGEADPEWVNPTDRAIRGCDDQGCGHFGAPRGIRTHRGADYTADSGQNVVAAARGTVTRIGYPYADDLSYRYVEIQGANGYTVRELYVSPAEGIAVGSQVSAGQAIGTAQNLTTRYTGITNHVHVEIRRNGNYINPAMLIPNP